MTEYSFELPAFFDDDAAVIEAKGYFGPVPIVAADHVFRLFFYDLDRLRQEIADSLESAPCFTEPGLVVLRAVTRGHIESAIQHLASRSFLDLTGG